MKCSALPFCFIAVMVLVAVRAQENPTTFPEAKKLETDLYDTTERWQTMFGLDGKIEITEGRKNLGEAAADGDAHMSFRATFKAPGWYSFTFIRVNGERDYISQIQTIQIRVPEGGALADGALITPVPDAPPRTQRPARGMALVYWRYYPGGEGIPGGWKLLETGYSKDPHGISDDKKWRGE